MIFAASHFFALLVTVSEKAVFLDSSAPLFSLASTAFVAAYPSLEGLDRSWLFCCCFSDQSSLALFSPFLTYQNSMGIGTLTLFLASWPYCFGASFRLRLTCGPTFSSIEFGSDVHGWIVIIIWAVWTPFFFISFIATVMRRNVFPIKQREPLLLSTSAIAGTQRPLSLFLGAFVPFSLIIMDFHV